jgi:L-asparagine transporter-like permease
VGAIVVFILIAGAYALGITSPSGSTFGNLIAHDGFAPFGTLSVLAGVTTVIFSLCGAEIVTIAAAESNEATSTMSRLTSTIIVRILLFYVLSVLLVVAIVPWKEIVPGVSPFAVVLERLDIPAAATIMNLIVLTAVLSCLNSGLYVTSRTLFVLAARGDAPQSMVKLNRRRVPVRAILIGSAFGYVTVLTSVVAPEVLFSFLVNASGALMLMIYGLVCVAQIKLRRRMEREHPERLTVKVWFFPALSLLAIAAIIGVMAAMLFTPDLATQLYASLLCLALVIAAYFARRKFAPTPAAPLAGAAQRTVVTS